MNKIKGFYYLAFFVNPFFALFVLLMDLRKRNIAFLFPVFLAFVGASFFHYGDSERYRDIFYEMHDQEVSWLNFKSSLLDGETSFDIAVPVISFFIASFTRNEKILFAVFGFILGIFYGRNIQFILDKLDKKNADRYVLFLVIIFSFLVTFWSGINGVRMWTAAHIFFYGAIRILEHKEHKAWSFIVLASAYHFSFLIPTTIFLIYSLFSKRNILFPSFVFFVISIFLAEIGLDLVRDLASSSFVGDFFNSKVNDYTNADYVNVLSKAKDNHSWHFKYYGNVIHYSFLSLLIASYYHSRKKLKQRHPYYRYFVMAFIFFGFANFFSMIPSGGRFMKLAYMFLIIPIYFGYVNAKTKGIYYVSILPLLFWLIITIRTSFFHLTLGTIIGNPLIVFLDFITEDNLESLIK